MGGRWAGRSDEQVAALASSLSGTTIDQLWCNAGLLEEDDLDSVNFDSMRRQFEVRPCSAEGLFSSPTHTDGCCLLCAGWVQVNTLGPLRVTKALLPNLKKGSKVGRRQQQPHARRPAVHAVALSSTAILEQRRRELTSATHGPWLLQLLLVTSRMGSLADNSSGGYYGYRASKAGLNMVGG